MPPLPCGVTVVRPHPTPHTSHLPPHTSHLTPYTCVAFHHPWQIARMILDDKNFATLQDQARPFPGCSPPPWPIAAFPSSYPSFFSSSFPFSLLPLLQRVLGTIIYGGQDYPDNFHKVRKTSVAAPLFPRAPPYARQIFLSPSAVSPVTTYIDDATRRASTRTFCRPPSPSRASAT